MSITQGPLAGYAAWLQALFPPMGHDLDVPDVTEPELPLSESYQPDPITALASAFGTLIDTVNAPFYGVFHDLLQAMGIKAAPEKVAPQDR